MKTLRWISAGAAAATALTWAAYRKELDSARQRVQLERQFVDSPQGRIEFGESGDGPAVLVVHGAGGGFDQGIALGKSFLGEHHRIIAPSRFGYLGTPLPADASPEAQAAAHLRLLDSLRLGAVPVIGVSAGAPSALEFAHRHPDRCTALILVVPMAWAPPRSGGDLRVSPVFVPLLNAIASSDILFWTAMKVARPALVKTLLGTPVAVYRGASREERERVDEMLRLVLPISRRSAGIWNDSVVASNLKRSALEEVTLPTLVITAADDLYDTYERGLYTAEQIRDAGFIGFSTGGHLLLGHEKELRSEIAKFLHEHAVPDVALAV